MSLSLRTETIHLLEKTKASACAVKIKRRTEDQEHLIVWHPNLPPSSGLNINSSQDGQFIEHINSLIESVELVSINEEQWRTLQNIKFI